VGPGAPHRGQHPGTTLAELPGRQIDLSFARMGATGGINLRGTEGQTTLDFSLRGDEVVESADLRLDYTSPALLADLSHLKVYLNDELVQTLVLPKENLGKPQHIRIPIDPRFLRTTTSCACSSSATTPWNASCPRTPACGPISATKAA
jgi:hypothetical protein